MENRTCRTCKDNDNGLCDRTGHLVEEDDTCSQWRGDWREAMLRAFLRRPGRRAIHD